MDLATSEMKVQNEEPVTEPARISANERGQLARSTRLTQLSKLAMYVCYSQLPISSTYLGTWLLLVIR